jgi:hypothetical protein
MSQPALAGQGRLFDGAQTEIGSIPLGTPAVVTKPVIGQTAWQFFNDNAAPAASTALGTVNTQYPVDIVTQGDKRYQLRIQIKNQDASVQVSAPLFTLQRRYNGGPWEPVSTITWGTEPDLSAFFANGDVISSRLTSPGGSLVSGYAIEGISAYQTAFNLPALNWTELVWCVKIVWAEINPNLGDVIDFRMVRDGSPDFMTFTQTPSVTFFRSGVTASISDNWGTWNATATAKVDKNLIAITAIQWCKDDATPDTSTFTGDTDGRITVPVGVSQWQMRWQWRHDGVGFQDASQYTLEFRIWTGGPPLSPSPWYDLSVSWGITMALSPNYANNFYMGNVPARCGDIDAASYMGTGRAASNTGICTGNLSQGLYNEYCWCLKVTNQSPFNIEGNYAEFRIRRDQEYDNINYGAFLPMLRLGTWSSPVTGVVATVTGQKTVTVTWTAVTGARAYDIERNGVVIASNWPASPYNDSGLTLNTAYNYRVIAVG